MVSVPTGMVSVLFTITTEFDVLVATFFLRCGPESVICAQAGRWLCSDHWRKNIPVLAKSHRVFAIDLLGYGYSDKPNPRLLPPNTLYTFDTWGKQILQFCSEVVNDRPFIICNSVGGWWGTGVPGFVQEWKEIVV